MKESTLKLGSPFYDVYYWNKLAGVEKGDCKSFNSEIARDLVIEEYHEYMDALDHRVNSEIAKELSDLLFVVIGAFYRYGLDAKTCLSVVTQSNASKFCTNEEDAKVSVAALALKGKEAAYKKVDDFYIIYDINTGKILKGIHYKPADFGTLDLQTDGLEEEGV